MERKIYWDITLSVTSGLLGGYAIYLLDHRANTNDTILIVKQGVVITVLMIFGWLLIKTLNHLLKPVKEVWGSRLVSGHRIFKSILVLILALIAIWGFKINDTRLLWGAVGGVIGISLYVILDKNII